MLRQQVWMTVDDEFDYISKNSQSVLGLSIYMKIIHMLNNLQNSVMLCLSMEHTP